MQSNLRITENLLLRKIETLNRNIKSAIIRKKMAKKVLNEYSKLYNKGRADLDSLIRSEENLINTEKIYIKYISDRDIARFNLAYLYGTIGSFILNF